MIETIASIVNAVIAFIENFRFAMGLVIGALVDAIVTVIFSYPLWGAFNFGLFVVLFIPCVVVALYWQMKAEK